MIDLITELRQSALDEYGEDDAAMHICTQAARKIETLQYENDDLKDIVWGWYCRAVRPDDVSIYYTEEQLIEASEPYTNPAI